MLQIKLKLRLCTAGLSTSYESPAQVKSFLVQLSGSQSFSFTSQRLEQYLRSSFHICRTPFGVNENHRLVFSTLETLYEILFCAYVFFFSFYCRRRGLIFGWYLWYDTNSVTEFTQSNKFTFGRDFKCHLVEYLPVLFYTWENWVLKTLNYLIKYSYW